MGAIDARTFGCCGSCMCSMLLRPWRICTLGTIMGLPASPLSVACCWILLSACSLYLIFRSCRRVWSVFIKKHGAPSLLIRCCGAGESVRLSHKPLLLPVWVPDGNLRHIHLHCRYLFATTNTRLDSFLTLVRQLFSTFAVAPSASLPRLPEHLVLYAQKAHNPSHGQRST